MSAATKLGTSMLNPMWVQFADTVAMPQMTSDTMSGLSIPLKGSPSGSGAWRSTGSTAAGAMRSIGGIVGGRGGAMSSVINAFNGPGTASLASSIVPGSATGGDVLTGVPIDLGGMGRERFTPPTNGHITPNHELRGQGAFYSVNMNSGASAAEMKQYLSAALTRIHGSAVQTAVGVQKEYADAAWTRAVDWK